MSTRHALFALVILGSILRLALAAGFDLGHDEAYHLLYTRRPDWSYVDHPPAVAVLAQLGRWLFEPWLGGRLGPRLPFVLLFAVSTLLMARLAARVYDARAGLAAAFCLNAAGYFGLAASSFILPDGPLLFFWLLALDAYLTAVGSDAARDGRLAPWVALGLAIGGALLSKYHGLLLPVGLGLHLVTEPTTRGWLRRPGPYLALAVAGIVFAPVVGWNAARGWVSFVYQGGRAVPASWWPRPDRFAIALVGQIVYTLPWVWLALVTTLGGRSGSVGERFFRVQAVVPLLVFGLVAAWQPTLPHWGLIGLVPLMAPAGQRWVLDLQTRPTPARRRVILWAAVPVLAGALIVAHQRLGVIPAGLLARLGLAPAADPTLEPYGWDQIAQALRRLGAGQSHNSYVFTSQWYQSGQLAAALGPDVPVLCYSARKPVSFATWSEPASWVGWDGLLVVVDPRSTEPAAFEPWFERIEPLGTVAVTRGGSVVRTARLYRCVRQVRPFPFAQAELWSTAHDNTPGRLAGHDPRTLK
ncbi:MAG: glycoside hydrolase [Isosphaeraceae bacterium]|jgi:4-amino-4-deoxy-L-arabinose transferase-like glycosyltransferase|nr:MAG: glycoside hydrolase [Isosphaeraceae bacterium]